MADQPIGSKSWKLSDRSLAFQFIAAGGIVATFTLVSLVVLFLQLNRETQGFTEAYVVTSVIHVTLLVVVGIALANLFYAIARPISELSRSIQRYQSGDFGARVQVSSQTEIGFLEASYNEMAEKIEAMVGDLRKLDEMKSEFLSTVSHELRTPLTSIGGYAKLLAAGDAGPITDIQKEFLLIIDTNVVRLTHLINDILDFEKMSSGKMQLELEPQDLISVLKECRDTFGVVAAQKGLELRFKLPDHLSPVMGERARLIQVFMNLLSNAIKYTQHGYVEVSAEEKDFAICIRVTDSGVGLSPAEQEKLFQRFYRARSGIDTGEGGTGLGLVIVRQLVEAHGGSITVESESTKGTTFAITLPASQLASLDVQLVPDEVPSLEQTVVPQPKWIRPIWAIDSSPADVEQMRGILSAAGAFYHGASVSVKAFTRVEDVPMQPASVDEAPVMVIIDPVNAGSIPALKKKLHKTVPILVVSSNVDPAAAFAAGASGLLTKPIGDREFLIAVKEITTTKGWRVLVADHNTDVRILIKRALEHRGYEVDDVERANQVVSRLERSDYDLALVDASFPDISGRELVKVIRRSSRFKLMPVFVMLDQDKNPMSVSELSTWDANEFVGKHQGIGGIVDAVCQYLEDKKLLEQNH